MASFVDADAFVRWEKGEFDLPGWMESHLGEGEAPGSSSFGIRGSGFKVPEPP